MKIKTKIMINHYFNDMPFNKRKMKQNYNIRKISHDKLKM